MVHETENAFRVVTAKNQMKCNHHFSHPSGYLCNVADPKYCTVIPKHNSVFSFAVPLYSSLQSSPIDTNAMDQSTGIESADKFVQKTVFDAPHIKFELYGNQFQFRASERAGRKFKHKETVEL